MKIAINLGSGIDYRESTPETKWVNVDNAKCKCDIHHNLIVFPYPFEHDTVGLIEMNSVLEHLPISTQQGCINECFRILKPGGQLIIRVPHFTSFQAWNDLEHQKPYTNHSFDGFVQGKEQHSINDYYNRKKFSSIETRIVFGKSIQVWNYLFEWLVNLSQLTKDIYEQTACSVNPAEGVFIRLTK